MSMCSHTQDLAKTSRCREKKKSSLEIRDNFVLVIRDDNNSDGKFINDRRKPRFDQEGSLEWRAKVIVIVRYAW